MEEEDPIAAMKAKRAKEREAAMAKKAAEGGGAGTLDA